MISVVIPLYNKEASIKQSLMSVLSQTYDDFEGVTSKSVWIRHRSSLV